MLLTDRYYSIIERLVVSGLDKNDPRLPKALCASCKRILNFYDEGKFTRTIEVFDYAQLASLRPNTRSNSDCYCYVCTVGRHSPVGMKQKETVLKQTYENSQAPRLVKICTFCLGEIGRGKPHQCTQTQRRQNLIHMLVPTDHEEMPKTSEQAI